MIDIYLVGEIGIGKTRLAKRIKDLLQDEDILGEIYSCQENPENVRPNLEQSPWTKE